ncbi:amidohydrolase [Microbacterium sp. 4R-513]|uniref:amidohydrolase n=1 Tax=Microbacterium sp. 4R-513 TaxID=2567934 RepID=UPI0013E156B7|nr:amidohydrolase [Microbacterium sp. 4R-513]QIG39489.1 amidohydrolase [Microbacterium sp. 4R-513]
MTQKMDAVFLADTVHVTSTGPTAQAIGVRDGRVMRVGSRDEAAEWDARDVVDFGGATITPGLIDAHSHAVSAGANRRGVDLSGCRDLDEVVRALLSQPDDEDSPWLLGWSFDPNLFGSATPDNRFLEPCGDRPVFVKMADGHSGIVNAAGLRLAGVTGREVFASHSSVVCDGDGEPTGLLLEDAALSLVSGRVPPLSPEAQAASLLALLHGMAATGLTTLSLLDLNPRSLGTLAALEESGDLPLRLRCSPVFDPGADVASELTRVVDLQGIGGRRWLIEGVKFVLDGTIDNGTAWLEQPDTFGDSTQSLWHDPDHFRWAVRELAERGIATATHAIGDAAIREAVAAIAGMTPAQRERAPHRIEHIETMPDDLLDAFARSGAIASMQPTHSTLYVWPDHQDEWSRRLGPVRAQVNGFRFRDLVDAGVTVALGSDWPVAPFDPRGVIADARLRRPHDREDQGLTFPRQALTAEMAVEGYTRAAARAIGWDDRVGTLEPGRYADLAVFEGDPLSEGAEAFAGTAVVATAIGGSLLRH